MRESIKQLLGILTESLPFPEPIVEFGSFQVPGQEGFADLRPLFPDKIYIGSDVREGPGVDRILDLHDIDLPSDSVGTALIIDTLEHVEFPRRALEEVHRVLRPGGMVVVTSVMNFQVHDYPHDYWRFTPEGLRSLLKPFTSTLVDHAGDDSFPHTVIGLGFKGAAPHLGPLAARIGAWRRAQPAWPPVSISPEARASRSRRRRWAGAAALAGLLALSYYLASAGLLAGLLACAALAAGLSYLLGYRLASRRWQTEKYRRRHLGVGALVLVGLALLLPYLSPRGRTAFPLWYLSLTCAASVVAHGVGRLWGRRKRRRRG